MPARFRPVVLGLVALTALLTSACNWVSNGSKSTDQFGTLDTPSLSADGRYLAFSARHDEGSTLVDEDPQGFQVYVRDLRTGRATGVTFAASGTTRANGQSARPSISADGRRVSYFSNASDLIAGDTNDTADVFVADVTPGIEPAVNQRVSLTAAGGEANGASLDPSISDDGNLVAFGSSATNLVAGDTNDLNDVYVRNLATHTTTRVSGEGGGSNPEISGDGRFVAYRTFNFENGSVQVFVKDLTAGVTTLASVTDAGLPVTGRSGAPQISIDGRYVAFSYNTSDLAGDPLHAPGAFRRDLVSGTTTRVSVLPSGRPSPFVSENELAISDDGRFVSFWVFDPNLQARGTVYVRDVASGRTSVGSADFKGQSPPRGALRMQALSGDGRYLAMLTDNDLVAANGSDEGQEEVYVRFTSQPGVTGVTPPALAPGQTQTVTVNGAWFLDGVTVEVPGEGVTVTSTTMVSATQLQVTLTVAADAPAGARNLSLHNPGTGPGPGTGALGACVSCLTIT